MRPEPTPICDVGAIDRRTWSWSTLSTTADGTFADADSGAPVLSADGRFAAFVTAAANLTGGTPGTRQIVLRDRDADGNGVYDEPGGVTLETISVGGASGIEAGDADSETPEVSDDGRFVAFRSRAANLVAGGTNGGWNAFLRDCQSGDTRQLNVSVFGQQSQVSLDEPQLSISADGRYVAFASADGSLLTTTHADDTNGTLDVFVYDRAVTGLVARRRRTRRRRARSRQWTDRLAHAERGRPLRVGAVGGDQRRRSADGRRGAGLRRRSHARGGDADQHRAGRHRRRDQPSLWPGLSADASVVAFWSSATSYTGIAPPAAKQFHAAAHLGIDPADRRGAWRRRRGHLRDHGAGAHGVVGRLDDGAVGRDIGGSVGRRRRRPAPQRASAEPRRDAAQRRDPRRRGDGHLDAGPRSVDRLAVAVGRPRQRRHSGDDPRHRLPAGDVRARRASVGGRRTGPRLHDARGDGAAG